MNQTHCLEAAQRVVNRLTEKNQTITFVESCTGGALAHFLTSVAGSGKVFHQSFVTYSEESKIKLGVSAASLKKYGVYSKEVAIEMAKAGLHQAVQAQHAVGVTGMLNASESKGETSKGDVHVAVLSKGGDLSYQRYASKLPIERRLELKVEFVNEIFEQVLRAVQ